MEYEQRPAHFDLFSGIAGFSLAAYHAGFRTIGFCEKDPYCQRVISKYWPSIKIYTDIFQLNGSGFRGIDLLTGGFPCQPFSQAGEQRGTKDDRYIWPEMFRFIQESIPAWVLIENVTSIDGLALEYCITDLESIKYEVAPPLEIPACAAGADQIRTRLWLLAYYTGQNVEKSKLVKATRKTKEPGMPAGLLSNYLWKPDRETYLAEMAGDVHGLSSWVDRSKGLGNSILPQVGYELIKAIRNQIRL